MANQKFDQRNEDNGRQNRPATPPAPDAPITENPESLRLIRAYYQASPTDEDKNTHLGNLANALADHLWGTDKYRHDRRLAVIRMALAATLNCLESLFNEPETRDNSRRRQQFKPEPVSIPSNLNEHIGSNANAAILQVPLLHHLREHRPLSDEASPAESLQWLTGLTKAYKGDFRQPPPGGSFDAVRAWNTILDKLPVLVEWMLLSDGLVDATRPDPAKLLNTLRLLFKSEML
ncbi:hypothetical protein B0T20DRAFT_467780 [Sordaria brevicollis]|uniref:Uncharacterized protein n=1 Tax=Sordaria brevicollis TaxID=83679 RepID=A0AAE0PJI7_SORBR|nr:hypothetical protein B0T20DRAFT_467780 [Sordaria brevicollis]